MLYIVLFVKFERMTLPIHSSLEGLQLVLVLCRIAYVVALHERLQPLYRYILSPSRIGIHFASDIEVSKQGTPKLIGHSVSYSE